MGPDGRPTPQADGFVDRDPEDYPRKDINPYLILHRTFGRPLLPAGEVRTYRDRWPEAFGREAPLILEIGSGNGEFMVELARKNPDHNILGIEIRFKRTVLCAKKIRASGLGNVLIARYHAAFLHDLFSPGSLVGIVANHPDPWPREAQEKNRLISRWFLEDASALLAPGGWLRIKSDFPPNCDRVVELLDRGPDGEPRDRLPLRITGRSADIDKEGAPWPDDILTNYQGKMKKKGIPVHGLEAVREKNFENA